MLTFHSADSSTLTWSASNTLWKKVQSTFSSSLFPLGWEENESEVIWVFSTVTWSTMIVCNPLGLLCIENDAHYQVQVVCIIFIVCRCTCGHCPLATHIKLSQFSIMDAPMLPWCQYNHDVLCNSSLQAAWLRVRVNNKLDSMANHVIVCSSKILSHCHGLCTFKPKLSEGPEGWWW